MGGDAKMFRTLGTFLFCLILLVGCHQEPKVLKPTEPKAPIPKSAPENPSKPLQEKNKPEKEPSQNPPEEEPNTEFKRLHYVIYEKGCLKWDIFAETARIYKGQVIHLTGLKVCSAPKKGFCITSRQGRYDPRRGTFFFRGNVTLRSLKQGSLKTSELSYLPKEDKLETSAPVIIDKEGLIIRGEGFVYDLDSGVMKVLKKTEVRVDG